MRMRRTREERSRKNRLDGASVRTEEVRANMFRIVRLCGCRRCVGDMHVQVQVQVPNSQIEVQSFCLLDLFLIYTLLLPCL
jgi:hypothetical protein